MVRGEMSIKERLNNTKEKVTAPAKFQIEKISIAKQMNNELKEINRKLTIIINKMEVSEMPRKKKKKR